MHDRGRDQLAWAFEETLLPSEALISSTRIEKGQQLRAKELQLPYSTSAIPVTGHIWNPFHYLAQSPISYSIDPIGSVIAAEAKGSPVRDILDSSPGLTGFPTGAR
jgi:hypothetical protein